MGTLALEDHEVDEGPNEFIGMLICCETERSFRTFALHVKILANASLKGLSLQAKTKGFILELAMTKM